MKWWTIAEKLSSGLRPRRRAEMLGHLADTSAAGASVGFPDVVSILLLVLRIWIRRNVPTVLAGLPVLVLYFMAFGIIYSFHFLPWDVMEEVPSKSPVAASLRRTVDLLWIVLLPLGLFSGWRAAARVRNRAFGLAGLFVGGLLVLSLVSIGFDSRNPWFDRSLQEADVDVVTAHAVVLLVSLIVLPLVFMALDVIRRPRGQAASPYLRSTPAIVAIAVLGLLLARFSVPLLA